MKNSLSVTALVLVWSAILTTPSAEAAGGVASAARPRSAPTALQGAASKASTPPAPGSVSGEGVPGSTLEATGCAPDWIATFGGLPGPNSSVHAMAVFDDGAGPALIVGGSFTSAGGVEASRIARWDGSTWSPLGSGFDGEVVLALAVFDDGGGPALYAGGRFTSAGGTPANHIAKWDGSTWSPVGLGMSGYTQTTVECLTVFDDGGGPALVAGGRFAAAGTVPANCVAEWDGTAWSALGGGLNPNVRALAVHDDGGGARLYAGGDFTGGGGVALSRIARWDGLGWTPLGAGMDGPVHALTSYDDGAGGGPALFAGGSFTGAGGVGANRVAKWDGASWSALAAGISGTSSPSVQAMAVHDEGLGGGQALFVTGTFTNSGGLALNRIARWDGASWSALDAGIQGSGGIALAVFNDGGGNRGALYVGGGIAIAGTAPVSHVARWDGASWSALGASTGTNYWTHAVAEFDDGGGPALYTGGSFSAAGGVAAARAARWDGSAWSSLGSGLNSDVYALTTFDDGGGPALYAGGGFTTAGGLSARGVAQWDGSGWSALGSGLNIAGGNAAASALHAFDDGGGPALYVGGYFSSAGGVPASHIARWNGTAWSALGTGFNSNTEALVSFDDGSGGGPALYAGGSFSMAGAVPVSYLAKWDGAAWSQVGGGLNGRVLALAVFDDGTGAALYAAGHFTMAGGVSAPRIARWDGSTWSALGSGPDPLFGAHVGTLAVFDPGTGPELFAGGTFTSVGGAPAGRIARWNGTSWHALGDGVNEWVLGLGVVDVGLGQGPSLYVVGRFTVSPASDSYIARWGCASSSIGYAYCFGDGSGTACPCANAGGPAEGCANSTGAGAVLAASGSNGAAADDLALHARRVPASQPALLFVGNVESNGGSGFTFGDGLRCAAFGVRRLGVSIASPGGQASWGPGLGTLGAWVAGDTRRFQTWYRDPVGSPCGSGFNFSNGFGVTFTP